MRRCRHLYNAPYVSASYFPFSCTTLLFVSHTFLISRWCVARTRPCREQLSDATCEQLPQSLFNLSGDTHPHAVLHHGFGDPVMHNKQRQPRKKVVNVTSCMATLLQTSAHCASLPLFIPFLTSSAVNGSTQSGSNPGATSSVCSTGPRRTFSSCSPRST